MLVVGICGGSGAGKSTVVRHLVERVGPEYVSILEHDSYYRDLTDMPAEVRAAQNFDHPESLDTALFLRHIDELRAGRSIQKPTYDFTTHRRRRETETIDARPVLLLDGLLLLALPTIRDRIDLRVFVEAPDDIRIVRRVVRDINERGRKPGCVYDQYVTTVRPMYREFIEPSRPHAHIILPWEFHNHVGVDVIVRRIQAELVGLPG